ncbi:MAG: sugar phosphate isomerase/epimerase [Candidatus Gastranaerophilales bacterium]|nr:sugar phosphate isomerase/epimerase [Candidatus Gastranaerophilales bacterium]
MNIFISSSIRDNINETVELATKLETGIEVCKFAEPGILDGNFDAVLSEFSDAFKTFAGQINLHGAFYDLNPVSKDPRIRDITIYRYNQSFKAAKVLEAKTVVFHTGYNGMVKFPVYHEMFIENKIIFWKEFIKRFEDENITVVLENTYEDNPDIILSIIDGVNSPNLKFCIDTGHVNINSALEIKDWIEKIGSRLHHMHIHNNSKIYDEHNSLLQGTIDFNTVLETLKNNNLNPDLTVEIFKYELAIESVEFLKEI